MMDLAALTEGRWIPAWSCRADHGAWGGCTLKFHHDLRPFAGAIPGLIDALRWASCARCRKRAEMQYEYDPDEYDPDDTEFGVDDCTSVVGCHKCCARTAKKIETVLKKSADLTEHGKTVLGEWRAFLAHCGEHGGADCVLGYLPPTYYKALVGVVPEFTPKNDRV